MFKVVKVFDDDIIVVYFLLEVLLGSGLTIKARLCHPSTSDVNPIKFPKHDLFCWEVVQGCTLVAAI